VAAKENIINIQSLPAASDSSRWYAIYTKPAKEDVVIEYIARLNVECFNPKIKKSRKIWGALKEISVPLFPCYVFAKLAESCFYAVGYARGARRVVGAGDAPTPIDQKIIDFIQSQTFEGGNPTPVPKLLAGDTVMINRGPLYGLEGILLEEVSSKDRVSILLKALEWQARVHVEKSTIEKLDRSKI
jgi:transcriptional antiterminator RfaH